MKTVTSNAKRQARFRENLKAKGFRERGFIVTKQEERLLGQILDWLRDEDPYKTRPIALSKDGTIHDISVFL